MPAPMKYGELEVPLLPGVRAPNSKAFGTGLCQQTSQEKGLGFLVVQRKDYLLSIIQF